MMVNPGVDYYTKTLHQRKILCKTRQIDNLLETKKIPKPTYAANGGQIFTFTLVVENLPLFSTVSYATATNILKNG